MLIVEDNAMMRAALVQFLTLEFPGHSILEAEDGAGALEAMRRCRPQLVLMDIALPDANGLELTAEIKRAFPATTVIIVTQYDGAQYRAHARSAGAFGYITKERIYQELGPLLAQALDIERTRSETSR